MQTIGERLEDARKRKGISLREAAEATKIRSDFLSNIEQNKFEFELPEIYKRGFIKNYARYLKLDPEKVINDYSAQLLSKTRSKKGGAEWFGSMDVKGGASDEPDVDATPSFGSIKAKPGAQQELSAAPTETGDADDKLFYLKVGLIFVGTLALVFVIFGLVRAIIGGPGETIEAQADLSTPAAVEAPIVSAAPVVSARTSEFKLTAYSEVFVAARNLSDRQFLYQGTLSAGDEIVLQKEGPVEIVFTRADQIAISANGKVVHSPQSGLSGTGKIELP